MLVSAENCLAEVVELHQFFEDWFIGRLPLTDEAFERFSSVMAPTFEIVSPQGTLTKRPALMDGLFGTHSTQTAIKIWIENSIFRPISDQLGLVTYEEWQSLAGESKGRLSSAIFRGKAGTPNQVEWLHVHETWL